ncbi:predicted protein [Sclerotinia sclerotiorum 1980 UF-70]|uniref:Uncharacterized protein n=1 Tax=Sclerotinia sclerotiorum (strain ATCC 18683 / 1980 / Ss-1) TaxID=665079 RepID=A7E615_SCLS1|nr:predicted protein [Sclerotinia sclerotiorum 1980 UF-70]EDN91337.1 predicted protein [Sclerotinia sclerotiorum 1980 UF-70]
MDTNDFSEEKELHEGVYGASHQEKTPKAKLRSYKVHRSQTYQSTTQLFLSASLTLHSRFDT